MNKVDYKTLKPNDTIYLAALCYTEADGMSVMHPGVYKVSEVPEFVLQVGIWRLHQTTKTVNPTVTKKSVEKPKTLEKEEEGNK